MTTQLLPAAVLPVGLDEVRDFLRLEAGQDDALLAGFIRAATDLAEAFTGQRLIARGFSERVPSTAVWTRLSNTPALAIDGVDGAGGPLPGGDYESDIDRSGDGWVRISAATESFVSVRYTAGMAADWNGVPESLRAGIVRLVAHFYTHRDAPDAMPVPAAVAALWRPFRRMRLA